MVLAGRLGHRPGASGSKRKKDSEESSNANSVDAGSSLEFPGITEITDHSDAGPTQPERHKLYRFNPPEVRFPRPDPSSDFRTYKQVSESLAGVGPLLTERMRNQGRVGYSAVNSITGASKAAIMWDLLGHEVEAEEHLHVCRNGLRDLKNQALPDRLAEVVADEFGHALSEADAYQFLKDPAQEAVEAWLHHLMWPVVKGESEEIPKLPTVREFEVPVQSVLAGYIDVIGELSKSRVKEGANLSIPPEKRLELFGRYLRVADSILLALHELKSFPAYVVNNSNRRGQGFHPKLNRAEGTLMAVRRECEHALHVYQCRSR